jgi:hypothetical protein
MHLIDKYFTTGSCNGTMRSENSTSSSAPSYASSRCIGANVSVSAIDKKTWVHILRSCGLTDEDMTHWHAQFEYDAPDAHHAFLFWLGITQDEALKIRRRAKHKTGKKR